MIKLTDLLYVGVGGFLGANSRFILSAWVATRINKIFNSHFPYGTLIVNVVGSIGLAVFGVWVASQSEASNNIKLLIGTGFFGAFTTFSTYANESVALVTMDHWQAGIGSIVLNNGLCLAGVLFGLWIANR